MAERRRDYVLQNALQFAERHSPCTSTKKNAEKQSSYVALAWQNERGIRGAWSEYKTAIVP